MPTCISHIMQFLYLLSVYLSSSLLSKFNEVVIPSSILGPKEKANWRILRLSSHLYRYFTSTSDDIWRMSPPFLHLFYEYLYSDGRASSIFSLLTCKSYNLRCSNARIQRRFIAASLQGPRPFSYRPSKPTSS